jgi:pantothenate kinase
MKTLSRLGQALLKCVYTTHPSQDSRRFLSLSTKDQTKSHEEFCNTVQEIVQYHVEPCDELVTELSKFLSAYKKKRGKENDELKASRENLEKKLSNFLLLKFRPDNKEI